MTTGMDVLSQLIAAAFLLSVIWVLFGRNK